MTTERGLSSTSSTFDMEQQAEQINCLSLEDGMKIDEQIEKAPHTHSNQRGLTVPFAAAPEGVEFPHLAVSQPASNDIFSNLAIRNRKKRTLSGTVKGTSTTDRFDTITKCHSRNNNDNDDDKTGKYSSELLNLSNPSWKWSARDSGFAVLIQTRKTEQEAPSNRIEQETSKQLHKRESSLLDWKDAEKFDVLASRHIR